MRVSWWHLVVAPSMLLSVIACGAGQPRDLAAAQGARANEQRGADSLSAQRSALSAVFHPDHIQLGLPLQRQYQTLINPYEHDRRAVGEGQKLFISYNCADCHGMDGSGAMGPSLQDDRWHFGGTAGEVFQSIYEGRPDGMPAWGGRIADDQIWKLVAYVRSLSAGHQVATENFTGKTVERTGH